MVGLFISSLLTSSLLLWNYNELKPCAATFSSHRDPAVLYRRSQHLLECTDTKTKYLCSTAPEEFSLLLYLHTFAEHDYIPAWKSLGIRP